MAEIGQVRVLAGMVESRPAPAKGHDKAEIHTPDTVSLGVECADTGSSLFTSRFKVRLEDLDGNPDLKVSIDSRWGRGYAVVSNGDEPVVEVPIGSVGRWAQRAFFTPGTEKADFYLEQLQRPGVGAIEIEKDGGDGRITFHRTDGGNHGITVGRSLSMWRA